MRKRVSKYVGVYPYHRGKWNWGVDIRPNGELIARKFFINEYDAALYYDEWSRKLGKSKMNFPKENEKGFIPIIKNGLVYVPLTQNYETICDIQDYDLIIKYNWIYHHGYATTVEKGKMAYMHQLLNPQWNETDHINRDKLDNRRCNLRECNRSQNIANVGKRKTCRGKPPISKYLGVSKRPYSWQARIIFKGKPISIGRFLTEIEAAQAYNEKARELFGEFAYQNILEEST